LPLLARQELQGALQELRSSSLPPGHGPVGEGHTSGSTGTPVRFLTTAVTQFFWQAISPSRSAARSRCFPFAITLQRVERMERSPSHKFEDFVSKIAV
jgi:hypothetical protein